MSRETRVLQKRFAGFRMQREIHHILLLWTIRILSMLHACTVLSIEDRIHINLLNLFWEQKVLRLLKEMQMFITSLIQENCHIRQ